VAFNHLVVCAKQYYAFFDAPKYTELVMTIEELMISMLDINAFEYYNAFEPRFIMRTTVVLPDELIASLHALAVRRGQRGYSKVMEEAVSTYLRDQKKRQRDLKAILEMEGSWSAEEADEVRKNLQEARKNWST
jgi:predicted transcriptional regulator